MSNKDELAIKFWQDEFGINFNSSKYNEFPDPQILDPIWEMYFPPMLLLSDIIKEISRSQMDRNRNNIAECTFNLSNRIDISDEIFDNEENYSKYKLLFFQKLLKITEKLFEDTIQFPHEFFSFNDLMVNLFFIIKTNENKFSITDTDFLIKFLENLPCSTNFSVFSWGFSSHIYEPKESTFFNIRADIFFEILLKLSRQKHWILSTFFNSSGSIDLFLDQMMPFVSNNLNLFSFSKSQKGNFLLKKSESLFILIELIFDILIGYSSEISRFNEITNRLWKKLLFFISNNSNNENSDISLEIHVFRCCIRFLNFFRRKFPQPQFITFFNPFIFACEKSYHLRPLSLQYVVLYKQFGIPINKYFRNLFEQDEEDNSNSIINNNFDDDDDNSNRNEEENNNNSQINEHQNCIILKKSIDHNSILFMANYYNKKENLNNRSENCFQFIQLCLFQAVKDKILSKTICNVLPPLLIKARNETQWMTSFIKHICYFCVFALLKKKYMGRVILVVDLLSSIYNKVMESVQIEISNDAALMYATKRIPFSLICRLNPSPKFDKTIFHDLKARCNRETDFSKEILEQKEFKSNFTEHLLFSKLTPRQPQQPNIPYNVKTTAPRSNYKTCPSNISILSASSTRNRPSNRNNYLNNSSFSFGSRTNNSSNVISSNSNDTNNNNDGLSKHSIVQNRGRIHQIQQVRQQTSNSILYRSQFSNPQRQMIGSNRKSLMTQYQLQNQIPTSSSNINITQDKPSSPDCQHQTRNGIDGKIEPTKPVVKSCPSKKIRGTTQRLIFI